MQITEVTASWSETANLGNYSNVKPSLTLKATLGPDDFALNVRDELTAICKLFVQEQIDCALETEGQAAKYSTEPRFDVLVESWGNRTFILIVPHKTRLTIDGAKGYPAAKQFRLAAAQAYARERAQGFDRDDAVVAIYDASYDTMVIEDALLDITTAKATYEAEQRERQRIEQEEWAEKKRRREAELERERAAHRAKFTPVQGQVADDNEDDNEDDENDE